MRFVAQLKERYSGSEGLRKITHNVGWLCFDKVLRMGVGLVVVGWIARYLGPGQFGLWNYAIAFTSLFGAFAFLGLDSIVVRDLVKEPLRRDELMGSAFYLMLFAGIATLILTVFAATLFKPGDRLTLSLVALSGSGFVFQSVNVIDFYYQSQVKSKYTVYAQNAAFLIMTLVKIVLLIVKAPLLAFAIAGAVEVALGTLFLIITYAYNHMSIRAWRFKGNVAKQLLKDSWPLMLASLAIMIYMRIDQVMIGTMLGDRAVGIYSAAVRISEIWYFIPMAIVGSLFPTILESKKQSESLYQTRLQKLFRGMVLLGLLVALAATFFGPFVVSLLYGDNYASAGTVLILLAWSGPATCLGVASSSWLAAENMLLYSFYRTGAGCIVNVCLNLFLIPKYGINGAAVATLIAYFVATYSVLFFKNMRIIGLMMVKGWNLFGILK